METPDNATFIIPAYSAVEDVQKASVAPVNVSEVKPTVSQNSNATSKKYSSLYDELTLISEEVIECRNTALKSIS